MADTGAPHNLPYPVAGDPPNGPSQIQALANAVATRLVSAGKSIIATEESTTSLTYVTMTTPDEVSSVVLPTDGLIAVFFQAMIKNTADTATAAIFLGSTQVKVADQSSASPIFAQAGGGSSGNYKSIVSSPLGLTAADGAPAYTGDVTTGQILGVNPVSGGPCYIFAAAGTYTVSVRYKTGINSTSVTVKNRKLWVRALPF